ncbi:MAG: phospholipase D-like domain-containing protein [Candidatus Taylorbacteria bacterium]
MIGNTLTNIEGKKPDITPVTKWHFYLCAEDAWKAMSEACERATRRIDFEQFIFLPDAIGSQFAEMFIRKSKQGIKVRLLIDSGGSYAFYNSALSEKMEKEGVEIEFYNKISPLRLHNLRLWFFRDHRKLLTVDGKIGFVGGVGIADSMFGWRDTHLEITGDIVKEMENNFERMWKITIAEKFTPFPASIATKDGFAFVTNAPHNRERHIYRRIVSAIRSAKRYVYITTPYFIPDTRLFRALRHAARRGVDVRILVPKNSDHPFVDWASHFHFNKAFRSKIRIWLYTTMLHSKSIVIDDNWATIGSMNLDNYSLFFNYEANIVSEDGKFSEEIRGHFERDLAQTRELTADLWKMRGWHQKVLEFISTPFARFL